MTSRDLQSLRRTTTRRQKLKSKSKRSSRRRIRMEALERRELLAADLFISEYVEGSGAGNKAIEIYNPTASGIDLSDYSLRRYSNGGTTPTVISLGTGTLAASDVIVVANPGIDASVSSVVDISSGSISHNGDDAYDLYKISTDTVLDVFGEVGVDPGSAWVDSSVVPSVGTSDRTLVRKPAISMGNTDGFNPISNLSNEWTSFATDTFSDLGMHTSSPTSESSFVLINEVLIDVDGIDTPHEFVELRGDADTIIPDDTYLVNLEGDSSSGFPQGVGKVANIFDLSGLSFGSNGILLLSQAGSGYTIDPAANSLVASGGDFEGFNFFQSDVNAGQIENPSNSLLLFSSTVAPTLNDDYDTDNNGTLDNLPAGFTLLDSVSVDDGGGSDQTYGVPNFSVPGGSNTSAYVARVGNSTGNSTSDWIVSLVTGSAPNFVAGSSVLADIGAPNGGSVSPALLISGGDTLNIAEGGSTDSFDVTLNQQPASDVTVSVVTDAESTGPGGDLTFTPSNWNVPQTVTITAVDDSDVEVGHTSSITLNTSGDAAFTGISENLTANVSDNDVDFFVNEVRISSQANDNASNNFVEVYEASGSGNLTLSGLHLLIISGSLQGGSPTGGQVQRAIDLSAASTDGQGFTLIADDGSLASIDPGDVIETEFDLPGAPQTFAIVGGYDPSLFDGSLDPGLDGTLDVTPWAIVYDALSLDDVGGTSLSYAPQLGGVTVLGDNSFIAAGAARPEDGAATADLLLFADNSDDSPGFSNDLSVVITESGGFTGVVEGEAGDTVQFRLAEAPTSNVTITLTPSNSEITLSTNTLTFTPGNFGTNQTVTVTAVDDANDTEGIHSSLIELALASVDTNFDGAFIPPVEVTIADNAVASSNLRINEWRISSGVDDNNDNFAELYDTTGASGVSTNGLTLVAISGSFNPGLIDFVIPLDGGSTDADGYLLAHSSGADPSNVEPTDVSVAGLDFFGSPQTLFLVSGFTGTAGLDLDPTDSGNLAQAPWTTAFDSVTLDTAIGAARNYNSASQVLSNSQTNAAAGFRRLPNGQNTLLELAFADTGQDTPGRSNELPPAVRIVDRTETQNPGTDANLVVREGGLFDTFSVQLDSPPTSNVTVTLDPDAQLALDTFSPSTADTPLDLTFTPGNWFIPQQVFVAANDDVDVEGDHQGLITVSSASTDAAYDLSGLPQISAFVIDNETPDAVVVINEVLKDPFQGDDSLPADDSNLDGVFDAEDDEFVEIVNSGSTSVDISGWTLADSTPDSPTVRHVFASGTVLAPGQAIVVFGGGTPGNFGNALTATASTGTLSLGNGADAVGLYSSSQLIDYHSWFVDDDEDLLGNDGVDTSLARFPDVTGEYVDSDDFLGPISSPGLDNLGNPFLIGAAVLVTQTDGSTAVAEGGNTDTVDIVLSGTPSQNVTVTVTPTDAEIDLGDGAGVAINLTFTPGNSDTPQSVTVSAFDDTVGEGTHSSSFTISTSSGDGTYDGLVAPTVNVSIADDDLPTTSTVVINEARFSSSGGAVADFVELIGDPLTSFNGISLVIISNEFDPGEVNEIVDLSAGSTDADGFFLLADNGSSYTLDPGDLEDDFSPFGGPQTLLLVEGLGALAEDTDLDSDDDGVFDAAFPWTGVIAGISTSDNDGNADVFYTFTDTLGNDFTPPVADLDGNFAASAVARNPDETGNFVTLGFFDQSSDTPGSTNEVPDIEVTGLADTVIDSGDTTPSPTDGTDLGTVLVGVPEAQTFTITNVGLGTLDVTSVTLSGADAGEFSIDNFTAAMIGNAQTITFDVTASPADDGANVAVVEIASDDPDESPYTFTVTANGSTVTAPEIDVLGGGMSIVSGDTTPDPLDGTDFGSVDTDGMSTNTFTISNLGTGTLNVTNIAVSGAGSGDFMISNVTIPSAVAAGNDITFDLTFDPSAVGTSSATVTITNDDADEGSYTFDVTGEGIDLPNIIINEVDADQTGTDAAEFVELYDGGTGNTSLDGLVLVFYNGSDDQSYASVDLTGQSTDANGFFVYGSSSVPNVDLDAGAVTNLIQNGADAVALFVGSAASFPNDTPITTSGLIDVIVYGTGDGDDTGLLTGFGETTQFDESANGNSASESVSRTPDGSETIVAQAPTPGATNVVNTDTTPPEVTNVYVAGSTWTAGGIDALDGGGQGGGNGLGFEVTGGEIIPNSGVDTFYVQLSEEVSGVNTSDIQLLGINQTDYSPLIDSVTYSNVTNVATVTLTAPISNDRLRLAVNDAVADLAGNPIGAVFDVEFAILVADVTGDGLVLVDDITPLIAGLNASFPNPGYDTRIDFVVDGLVLVDDIPALIGSLNASLPAGSPAPANFSGSAPVASALSAVDEAFEDDSEDWLDFDSVELF
ncbi:MAG: choice-of-anchor D domain-containing protein [Planctomycetota bacterium]